MQEFFGGWKRKIGFVTLVMACVFLGGWVRSLVVCDYFNYRINATDIHFVTSGSGHLAWMHSHEMTLSHVQYENFHFTGATNALPPWKRGDVKWHWQSTGFHFGKAWFQSSGQMMHFSSVPYWSIVLPLTAISVWLLFSKPRPAKWPAIEMAE